MPVSPSHLRRPIEAGPATLTLAARRLHAAGFPVELHGTVVQPFPRETTAGLFIVSATLGLIGLLFPTLGMVLTAAAVLSALVDFGGGFGPFRQLIPRHAHRNLWLRAPAAREVPPQHHVLLVVPDDVARGPGTRLEVVAHGACLAATLLLLPLGLDHPGPRLLLFGFALIQVLIALAIRFKTTPPPDSTGGTTLAERLAGLAPEWSPHLHVSVAVVGGMWPWMDGLQTLLLNHRPRLHPQNTLVLSWTPSEGPLRVRSHEGLLQLRPVSPVLSNAARDVGIPTSDPRRDPSPAGRAMSLGWRAVCIEGALGDPERVAETFGEICARLDQAARDGRW